MKHISKKLRSINMIKIYGMNTCPYCIAVKEQMAGREGEFESRFLRIKQKGNRP